MTAGGGVTDGAPPQTPWYLTRRSVILGFIIAGPLALPLLWWSPRFSAAAKIGISVFTILTTVLLWKFSMGMIDSLTQRLEELKKIS